MHGSFDNHGQRSGWALAATSAAISVALILIVAKVIAWSLSGSAAILGSLADSSLDLVGSVLAFAGVKWASEPADEEHRFGHNKAEAMAGLAQVILISASALYVLKESIQSLLAPVPLAAEGVALGVMSLSLILSVGLIAFQTFAMRKSGSLAVEGDRAHYIGDVVANGGTLLAVFLAVKFQWLAADAIAGLAAAVFLATSAWSIGRRVIPQLMDEELSAEERQHIIRIVTEDPEVLGFHALRTRMAGHRVYIQLHLEMNPELKLRDAHTIAERVEAQLLGVFPGADIILHQDPHGEDDAHDEMLRDTALAP